MLVVVWWIELISEIHNIIAYVEKIWMVPVILFELSVMEICLSSYIVNVLWSFNSFINNTLLIGLILT